MTDNDLNEAIRSAVVNALSGMSHVMVGAAQEFADRTLETVEEMREEAADAKDARQSRRRLQRLARLAQERAAALALLESADEAGRVVLEQRIAQIDTRVREAAGIPASQSLPAPAVEPEPGKVAVRPHQRRKPGCELASSTNGSPVEN